jgi:hypothetical protein
MTTLYGASTRSLDPRKFFRRKAFRNMLADAIGPTLGRRIECLPAFVQQYPQVSIEYDNCRAWQVLGQFSIQPMLLMQLFVKLRHFERGPLSLNNYVLVPGQKTEFPFHERRRFFE